LCYILISVPGKVKGLTSTSSSSTSISLQWTKVSGDVAVEYVITWKPTDSGGSITVNDGSNQTTLNGLNSNTNYKFHIQAKNNGGSGRISNEVIFTTSKYLLQRQ